MTEIAHRRLYALGDRLALPADGLASLASELVARYGEKHRRYHTLDHVLDCLDRLEEVRPQLVDPDAVELALWFHDVVYDPQRDDNETRSAVIARERLSAMELSAERCALVIELVLVTARPASAPPGDAAHLCDIDFSILGRDWPRYDAYRLGVRDEFGFVPDALFRAGRGKLLSDWLGRPSIFHTDAFRARYEATARQNLERELAELTAPR